MREVVATIEEDGSIGIETRENPQVHGVALERGNTINTRVRCAYMDVGLWGRRQYNFGVLYGDRFEGYAAVCNYVPGSGFRQITALPGEAEAGTTRSMRVVRNFLNACRGEVIEGGRFLDINTDGKLYLYIGDLHFPVVTRRSPDWVDHEESDRELPEVPCRVDNDYMESIAASLTQAAQDPILATTFGPLSPTAGIDRLRMDFITRWYESYFENDIFTESYESWAAVRLKQFLERVMAWEGADGNVPVHMVQLGDMYDFWVGLRRRFEGSSGANVTLSSDRCGMNEICVQGETCAQGITVRQAVQDWLDRTNQVSLIEHNGQGMCLAAWLQDDSAFSVSQKTWLYGNHDNYLKVLYRDLGLPQRLMRLVENRVFMEHGHQGDEYNRDGATGGHDITQGAAFVWNLRWVTGLWFAEAMNRETVLRRAVEVLRDPERNLRAYVMGHTHTPYLAYVTIGREQALDQPGE